MNAPESLRDAYGRIQREAWRPAGEPADMPRRVASHHGIFLDSKRNHAFPEVALHGALWAYGFYESTGTVSRLITYRYFYDRRERAKRTAMLTDFSEGFKEANRSVFVDTYANYHFTKIHGEEAGAEEIVTPPLLEQLNRVHRAARADKPPTRAERRGPDLAPVRAGANSGAEGSGGSREVRLPDPDSASAQADRALRVLLAAALHVLRRLRQHRRAHREGRTQLRVRRACWVGARRGRYPRVRRHAAGLFADPAAYVRSL